MRPPDSIGLRPAGQYSSPILQWGSQIKFVSEIWVDHSRDHWVLNLMSTECIYLRSIIPSSMSIWNLISGYSWKWVRAALPIRSAPHVQQEPPYEIFQKSRLRKFFKNHDTSNSRIPNKVLTVWFPLSPVWMCRMPKQFLQAGHTCAKI